MDPIIDIQKNLAAELNLQDFPQETQDEILTKISQNILQSIVVTLMEKLSEEKRAELEAMGKGGDQAQVAAFLAANIPDYQQIVASVAKEEIEDFKKFQATAQEQA